MDSETIILSSLRECVGSRPRPLVVHSSLYRLSPPSDVGKWDFLSAFNKLAEEGWTLAIPTFTFAFCRGSPYHWRQSEPETGVLGRWLLDTNIAKRTPHPIYSFAVLGPRSDELTSATNTSTFGDDSIFAAFERLDAWLIMLGCDWQVCTQFHRYEEEARVPYRFFKTFAGNADFGDGPKEIECRMFVRNLDAGISNDFSSALTRLRDSGAITEAPLWRGRISASSCKSLADISRNLLAVDPYALTLHPRISEYRTENRRRIERTAALKIAVLGSANLTPLAAALCERLKSLVPDQRIEVFAPAFGQMTREVMTVGSNFAKFDPDITFFTDRLEDLVGEFAAETADRTAIQNAIDSYIHVIRRCREITKGWISVNMFLKAHQRISGAASTMQPTAETIDPTAALRTGLTGINQLHVFDLAEEAARTSASAIFDSRLWFVGRLPFSAAFTNQLAERFAGIVLAATGRTARLIIIDLDNTIWGGILGEDGMSGLKIGGDYPGNAYRGFQMVLKSLTHRGIALAVVSKNDERQTVEAIETLPGMALKMNDFVSHRINWKPKHSNILEICDELGLGLASVLFIDDNPAECEQIRQLLPAAQILDLPKDPALYAETLLNNPWIECLSVTTEDRRRTAAYKSRAQVRQAAAGFQDLETFYASLGTRIHLQRLGSNNVDRAVQLIAKTNQFNVTTKRYSRKQLEEMAASGSEVIVIGVEDNVSTFENVGVLVIHWNVPEPNWGTIDTYLLSCRVLGRGIETGVLYGLIDMASARGAKGLVGSIIETDRNTPARSIYSDAGFLRGAAPGEWRIGLSEVPRSTPSWLTIIESVTQKRELA